jgi:hypothetical protein
LGLFAAKPSSSPRDNPEHYNDYENHEHGDHPSTPAASSIVSHLKVLLASVNWICGSVMATSAAPMVVVAAAAR